MTDIFELHAVMSEKQAKIQSLKTQGENMGLSIQEENGKLQRVRAATSKMTQQGSPLSAIRSTSLPTPGYAQTVARDWVKHYVL